MDIAFLRHAPTEWSQARRLQGRSDVPLSATGRAAARQWTLPAPFDAWPRVSSPLARCRETAQLIAPTATFSIEEDLIEASFGEFEGENLADLRARLGDVLRRNEAAGVDFCPPGGESPRMVQARLNSWFARLNTDATFDAGVVAIAHKGVIRAALSLALDWDMITDAPVKLKWQHLHRFTLDTRTKTPRLRLLEANIALDGSS